MKILIVDDEPAIAETLSYTLHTEGFEVECCTLGSAALHRLSEGGIDFVVLDIGLPDMTGFDVCRALRQQSSVPVLFLTARSEEIDRILGLELGADDYVAKPFSPREIASRIRAIQRRLNPVRSTPRPTDGQPQKAGHFQLDEAGQRIAFHQQWLALTRYEYLLLALLCKQSGRVLSRQQIMDAVWQDGGESLERTVDTHIKTLRSKLRAIRDEEVIHTHRGLGYSLTL